MTCTVKGAKDEETAEVLAKLIAGSSLTQSSNVRFRCELGTRSLRDGPIPGCV
ncbi:MAG: hypothetical protein ACLR8P_00835 [Clostridium fessum]